MFMNIRSITSHFYSFYGTERMVKMNRPFMKIGFLGLLVLGMSIVLLMVFPSKAPWMMDGFFTPVMD